jgi:hypothetical protein
MSEVKPGTVTGITLGWMVERYVKPKTGKKEKT